MFCQHHRYFTLSVSLKTILYKIEMFFVGLERCGVFVVADGYDAAENMLCLRKITISSVALACRRVGSKRVKSLPSCKKHIINIQFYLDKKCR